MEVKKKHARELVESSSYARNNILLFLILIVISTITLIVFTPKSYAANELISDGMMDAVIDYYQTNISIISNNAPSSQVGNQTNMIRYLEETKTTLKNNFNNYINSLNKNVQLENLLFVGGWGGNQNFHIALIIADNDTDSQDFGKVYFANYYGNNQYENYAKAYNSKIYGKVYTVAKKVLYDEGQVTGGFVISNYELLMYTNGDSFTNKIEPSLLAVGNSYTVYDNNLTLRTITNKLDYSDTPNYIIPNSSGDLGYKYENDGITTINQYDGSINLKQRLILGNKLQYVNEYYYYNESGDKINADNLVYWYEFNGDTYNYYIPQASWPMYNKYYGKNIYEDLKIQYYSGDELLQEIILEEETQVIDWVGTTQENINTPITGTITNSSGEIIGNYSGEQSNENIQDWATKQPDLSQKNITAEDIKKATGIEDIESQEYSSYTNFWYEMLNQFKNALTGTRRTITIEFLGQNHTINLDEIGFQYPSEIQTLLATIITIAVVIYITKFSKEIVEDIQTASIDNVADKLTEDFVTNIF